MSPENMRYCTLRANNSMRSCWSRASIAISLHPSRSKSTVAIPIASPPQRLFQVVPGSPSESDRLHLHQSNSEPSDITEDFCSNLLAFCTKSKSTRQGICVHGPIVKLGFHDLLPLSNHLLTFYSKACGLESARKLFDELTNRDVVTWTGIISTYSRIRSHEEALELFKCMLDDDDPASTPNEYTFSTAVRCAASLRSLDLGAQIHAQVEKHGLAANVVVGSALLDVYSKCGVLGEASEIFTSIEHKDVVSWTTLISALVESRNWSRALQIYSLMLESGTSPTEFTFAKLLTACGCLSGHRNGTALHAHLILCGMELNLVLKTVLVDMYSKCDRMDDALRVFRRTTDTDVMLWTAMISGFSQAGRHREAISMFRDMEKSGVEPNSFTYAAVLSACSSAPEPELGNQIHCWVVKVGLEHDVSVGNSLIDLYAKSSLDPDDTLRAFGAIGSPNVVSWTTYIAGLGRHGFEFSALSGLVEMRLAGIEPNSYTLSTVLCGCNSADALVHARKLHGYMIKVASSDLVSGNSLVDLYARYGLVDDAWAVASTMMPQRDVLTYTSLAKGLNQLGLHRRALVLLARMRDEGVEVDSFSIACFLSAAAGLAAAHFGEQLHGISVKSGLLSSTSVSNGLVDMYGKCGRVEDARRAFASTEEPNVVSWNGLISGLASNGLIADALSAFEDMRLAGARPDGVTFLLLLYACSHGGLVDAGVEYFESMREVFGVLPQPEHYVCLVDMLGRAGRLEAAVLAIETMPFKPDALVYKTLLASCRQHRNLVLGECTARRALAIDPADPAIYVLLAGMYDDAGKIEWGEETRRMMRESAKRKCLGQSWL